MLHVLEQQHEQEHYTQYAKGTRFSFHQRQKGDSVQLQVDEDSMIVVLEGNFLFQIEGTVESTLIEPSDCFTLQKDTKIKADFLSPSHYMVLNTEALSEAYNSLLVKWSDLFLDPNQYPFYRLQINSSVNVLCQQVKQYETEGLLNRYLCDLKGEELFFLLFASYRKDELARLFRPVMAKYYRPNFRNIITSNQAKVRTVKELIELTKVSKTVFYRRFFEEFGMSAKQWLQQKQLERIAFKATFPGMTTRKLMTDSGFKSAPQFHTFCKHNFGLTPCELIRRSREGEIILKS